MLKFEREFIQISENNQVNTKTVKLLSCELHQNKMLNSPQRSEYQQEPIGLKPKKSLKSRRNQKLAKAVDNFAPQEFGEIVKQENMREYNPVVLDSITEVNKAIPDSPLKLSNHDRDDSDRSSKKNSRSDRKNKSFTAEQTNDVNSTALPALFNNAIEALENTSNDDGLKESKVSTVLNIQLNGPEETSAPDQSPSQPVSKSKCKKKHKECKHKSKEGHKHHKHRSHHK